MKKKLLSIFFSSLLLLSAVGCGSQPPEDLDEELPPEIEFTMEAYQDADGILRLTQKDETGAESIIETGGLSITVTKGETVESAMTYFDYVSIEPFREGDTFEGWMEYSVTITVDEDGFEDYTSEIVSDKLYTTEDLMAMTVTTPGYYVAKWASIPVEDYFSAADAWHYINTSGAFAFSAAEGTMTFQQADGTQLQSSHYTYWLEEGQALNDIMGVDSYAALIGIEKEGATFTGWTLLEGDSMYWNNEPADDDTITSFFFDPTDEDVQYLLLSNAVIIRESASTEELCGLSMESNKCYYAVANWA